MNVPVFSRREDFVAFARTHGLATWHEPDEAGITARWTARPGGVGIDLDNAMNAGHCYGSWDHGGPYAELFVTICEDVEENGRRVYGRDLCAVSLATLCEWASTPLERPARIGDYIGEHGPIPANVAEVYCPGEDDTWQRVTEARVAAMPPMVMRELAEGGSDPTDYGWTTPGGGGWSTDAGLLVYAPLKVTGVSW